MAIFIVMTLDQYLQTTYAAQLAAEVGVSPAFVSQWRSGYRQVPAERCPAIERATGGAVKCEDLRPDVDWAVLRCTCTRDPETAHDDGGPREHELQEAA